MAAEALEQKEYRPVSVSRRSELTAWGIFAVLASVVVLFRGRGQIVPLPITILAVFFLLSALVISFGNWMERRTSLRIEPDRLFYSNGVRKVSLSWDEIREIRLGEDRLSNKVYIYGESAQFQIRLQSEPRFDREEHRLYGFREGDEILRAISERSGKNPVKPHEGEG
ncbi:MAG TPA: hypothetical protein VJ768_01695 [Anaerolineales bacterium]|nr:hypothetical protein [Anaerolineales bacterium]